MVKCDRITIGLTIDNNIAAGEVLHRLGKNYISDVLFEVCEDCFKMPSLPQGAFAVRKVKEQHQHVAVCKNEKHDEKPGRFDLKHNFSKLAPVKYNEKMMNSIWGRYNRNSPHNFKKNNAADGTQVGLQQPNAVAHQFPVNKNSQPNQQSQFLSAVIAAAGFGQGHHLSQDEAHHYEDHDYDEMEHGTVGPHGYHYGHHGHGKYSHYEQIWNFSVI